MIRFPGVFRLAAVAVIVGCAVLPRGFLVAAELSELGATNFDVFASDF